MFWSRGLEGNGTSTFIIIIIIIISGMRLNPLGTATTTGLLYQSRMIDDWWNENW
jgi:hypothetical protein